MGVQLHGWARPRAQDGVAQGLRKVQRERLTGLPGFGRLLAVSPTRHARDTVHAECRRIAQLGEEIAQGLLADLANSLGREVELTTLAIDEALILEPLQGLLQTHDVACRVIAKVAPNGLDVDLGQPLGGAGLAEELLQSLQLT